MYSDRAAALPLRILTWHVHSKYLYLLSRLPHRFFVPVNYAKPGYQGRTPGYDWGINVQEIPANEVRNTAFDCILYQSSNNYTEDRFDILSQQQRELPQIYLEFEPPLGHATNTVHPVADPRILLVHVTDFNRLMWDNSVTPARVIAHAVDGRSKAQYSGEIAKALVVVNDLRRRGRRAGLDIYERLRREVPVDLIGADSVSLGGLGEIPPAELPAFLARYRVFVNPIRYGGLSLAVCEAMQLGMPVIGLATTEMVSVVRNGISGYLYTDVDKLLQQVKLLLHDIARSRRLGEGARQTALDRFALTRFIHDWSDAIHAALQLRQQPVSVATPRLTEAGQRPALQPRG